MDINPTLARKWLSEVVSHHQLIIDTYNESHMPESQREAVLGYVARRITLGYAHRVESRRFDQ